jgi:hypothetical protein
MCNGEDLSHTCLHYKEYVMKDIPKSLQAQYPDPIIITCIRNVYDRIYSAYLFEKRQRYPCIPKGRGFIDFVKLDLPKIVQQQLKLFEGKEKLHFDGIHFVPMYVFVTDKNNELKYNHLIHQENFEEEVQSVFEKLGLTGNKIPTMLCSSSTPPIPYEYIQQYDNEAMRIVEKLYKRDFEIFNYPKLSLRI